MTIQEAKQILAENGRSTCSCKYGGDEGRMIAEAIKIKESSEVKDRNYSTVKNFFRLYKKYDL